MKIVRLVHNDSDRPDIDFIGMPDFSIQNFWSDIIGCTTNSPNIFRDFIILLPFLFSIELKLGGETKVCNFEFHLVIQEKISQFKTKNLSSFQFGVLSVDDAIGM